MAYTFSSSNISTPLNWSGPSALGSYIMQLNDPVGAYGNALQILSASSNSALNIQQTSAVSALSIYSSSGGQTSPAISIIQYNSVTDTDNSPAMLIANPATGIGYSFPTTVSATNIGMVLGISGSTTINVPVSAGPQGSYTVYPLQWIPASSSNSSVDAPLTLGPYTSTIQNPILYLEDSSAASGYALRIDEAGSESAIQINVTGAANALDINLNSSANNVNNAIDISVLNSYAIYATNVSSSNYGLIELQNLAVASALVVDDLNTNNTFNAIDVNYSGTGNALNVTGSADTANSLVTFATNFTTTPTTLTGMPEALYLNNQGKTFPSEISYNGSTAVRGSCLTIEDYVGTGGLYIWSAPATSGNPVSIAAVYIENTSQSPGLFVNNMPNVSGNPVNGLFVVNNSPWSSSRIVQQSTGPVQTLVNHTSTNTPALCILQATTGYGALMLMDTVSGAPGYTLPASAGTAGQVLTLSSTSCSVSIPELTGLGGTFEVYQALWEDAGNIQDQVPLPLNNPNPGSCLNITGQSQDSTAQSLVSVVDSGNYFGQAINASGTGGALFLLNNEESTSSLLTLNNSGQASSLYIVHTGTSGYNGVYIDYQDTASAIFVTSTATNNAPATLLSPSSASLVLINNSSGSTSGFTIPNAAPTNGEVLTGTTNTFSYTSNNTTYTVTETAWAPLSNLTYTNLNISGELTAESASLSSNLVVDGASNTTTSGTNIPVLAVNDSGTYSAVDITVTNSANGINLINTNSSSAGTLLNISNVGSGYSLYIESDIASPCMYMMNKSAGGIATYLGSSISINPTLFLAAPANGSPLGIGTYIDPSVGGTGNAYLFPTTCPDGKELQLLVSQPQSSGAFEFHNTAQPVFYDTYELSWADPSNLTFTTLNAQNVNASNSVSATSVTAAPTTSASLKGNTVTKPALIATNYVLDDSLFDNDSSVAFIDNKSQNPSIYVGHQHVSPNYAAIEIKTLGIQPAIRTNSATGCMNAYGSSDVDSLPHPKGRQRATDPSLFAHTYLKDSGGGVNLYLDSSDSTGQSIAGFSASQDLHTGHFYNSQGPVLKLVGKSSKSSCHCHTH